MTKFSGNTGHFRQQFHLHYQIQGTSGFGVMHDLSKSQLGEGGLFSDFHQMDPHAVIYASKGCISES